MKGIRHVFWNGLAVAVLLHLVVVLVHGAAHADAHVPLSRLGNLFVVLVIVAGPLVGLAMTWPAERFGLWIIAVTMMGSLVFGAVNHFIAAGPDHVASVDPSWQPLFATTAVLLSVTEALGAGLAIRALREERL
jgi:hypothetical protein